jgi:regulator of cell morphogenesis and NO signaling
MITTEFNEQSNVGEIVKKFPQAGDYFKSIKIDFCCGGNRPIVEAIIDRGLEVREVLGKLEELYQQAKSRNQLGVDWDQSTCEEVIKLIIEKHHQFMNNELPQLSPYVTKVLRVHGEQHPHLEELHSLFQQLKLEMSEHTLKEEIEVFPIIIQAEKDPSSVRKEALADAMRALEEEHDSAGSIIRRMREITDDFTPPEEACGTYRLVYQRLENMESDLFLHVHLENSVLFPKISQQLQA